MKTKEILKEMRKSLGRMINGENHKECNDLLALIQVMEEKRKRKKCVKAANEAMESARNLFQGFSIRDFSDDQIFSVDIPHTDNIKAIANRIRGLNKKVPYVAGEDLKMGDVIHIENNIARKINPKTDL